MVIFKWVILLLFVHSKQQYPVVTAHGSFSLKYVPKSRISFSDMKTEFYSYRNKLTYLAKGNIVVVHTEASVKG